MAMDAGWDEELLRVEIEALQDMDFDPLLTGFDEAELADLFGADEEYILSFYREAEKKYGSMEDFLRDRLGVTEEDRAAMQEMYLA